MWNVFVELRTFFFELWSLRFFSGTAEPQSDSAILLRGELWQQNNNQSWVQGGNLTGVRVKCFTKRFARCGEVQNAIRETPGVSDLYEFHKFSCLHQGRPPYEDFFLSFLFHNILSADASFCRRWVDACYQHIQVMVSNRICWVLTQLKFLNRVDNYSTISCTGPQQDLRLRIFSGVSIYGSLEVPEPLCQISRRF